MVLAPISLIRGHVLVVHLAGDGVADALAILMAGYAVQRVRLAVQEEALLGVNLKLRTPKRVVVSSSTVPFTTRRALQLYRYGS